MPFFATNLHAMLASVSANAREANTPEVAEHLDAAIAFFNEGGFPVQDCVRRAGLKWEALDVVTQNQIDGISQGVAAQRADVVRVQYLGRVVYAKPLMVEGDPANLNTQCLFQIDGSSQRLPIPIQFVVFQDRALFQKLISELSENG